MPEFFNRRNYVILIGLIFISMVIVTIHFREGENGPLHRAQRLTMTLTSPVQSAVTTILLPVKDGWDYLIHFGDLKRENRELNKEVKKLQSELRALRGLEKENERLRGLMDFKSQANYETMAAQVIGMPTGNWWSSIVVDKGLDHGVERNMPVIAGGGLVGQVVEVSRQASKVALLNDAQSGVSVQIERTGEVGVIKGQLKDRRLQLKYISRDSAVHEGDIVLTSGLGEIFPKGLYVGKVAKVRQSAYSLYKVVEVATPVDFLKIDEILIIKHKPVFYTEEGD